MNNLAMAVPPTDEFDDELEANNQFVTFMVGKEVFAVEMAPVQEIIRLPDVVRVPMAPPTLEGLTNLRGQVLPIISLRRVLGFPDVDTDDSTRAVVIDIGQPLGFVVDKVASVVAVDREHIDSVEGIQSTIDSAYLSGMLRDVGGHSMVMLLDFAALIGAQFAEIAALARDTRAEDLEVAADEDAVEDDDSNEAHLVSFSVAGQEYAFDINDVQEIVTIPESIVQVPHVDTHVLGLMTLRERLLPLVSLRTMFGLPVGEIDERSRVIVISLGNQIIGVVTDSVSEVLRVPWAEVDEMPALLARNGDLSEITQVCRLERGKRLVSIISTRNMFETSVVKDALEEIKDMENLAEVDEDEGLIEDDDQQVVVFRLADGEFGAPIEAVQEIVRIPDELTHVPRSPEFVEGVINLRGQVLPVIDQRRRMDLPKVERSDRQRIMVFTLNGMRTGFIVDAVSEVKRIPNRAIEDSPKLSNDQARLLGRIANLEDEKRMIQIIDPDNLTDDAEEQALAKLGDGEA